MKRFVALSMLLAIAGGCSPRGEDAEDSFKKGPLPSSFKVARPTSTDEKLAWAAIDVMWKHADFYEDEQTYQRSIALATKGQVAVYASLWYLAEVNNGGHHQFFFNSTGLVWEDALSGLELIGAIKHRGILSEAVALFPRSRPAKDRDRRYAQLRRIDEARLNALDDRLYDLDEDLEALAAKYILAHPDEFFE